MEGVQCQLMKCIKLLREAVAILTAKKHCNFTTVHTTGGDADFDDKIVPEKNFQTVESQTLISNEKFLAHKENPQTDVESRENLLGRDRMLGAKRTHSDMRNLQQQVDELAQNVQQQLRTDDDAMQIPRIITPPRCADVCRTTKTASEETSEGDGDTVLIPGIASQQNCAEVFRIPLPASDESSEKDDEDEEDSESWNYGSGNYGSDEEENIKEICDADYQSWLKENED